jgi:hypothetical protein
LFVAFQSYSGKSDDETLKMGPERRDELMMEGVQVFDGGSQK